jgi:hypothetical protein
MLYGLNELLTKLGAPEVKEKGEMSWHYFMPRQEHLAGHASVRLENGGEHLVAELHHVQENVVDDDGDVHVSKTESFYLHAERTARPGYYRITRLAFDGDEYPKPAKSVIELALSIFHARALDISIRMVEQTFNKQDILDPAGDVFKKENFPPRYSASKTFAAQARQERSLREGEKQSVAKALVTAAGDNVVLFRPRRPYAAANG